MAGQGSGGYGNVGLTSNYGRIGVARSYYVAALPFSPGMPAGGVRQRTWALGALPFGTAMSYGAEASGGSDASYYEQAGALIGAYQSAADVRRALEKKKADLAFLRQQRAKAGLLSPLLDWQISRTEADIAALEQKLALQLETEDSTRTWRSLGQTGTAIAVIGGIGVVGLIGLALSRGIKKARSNPRRHRRSHR